MNFNKYWNLKFADETTLEAPKTVIPFSFIIGLSETTEPFRLETFWRPKRDYDCENGALGFNLEYSI